jgi:hypothetical protein
LPNYVGQEHICLGLRSLQIQHEPIFYCHVRGQKDPWYGDKSQSTLWAQNKHLFPKQVVRLSRSEFPG